MNLLQFVWVSMPPRSNPRPAVGRYSGSLSEVIGASNQQFLRIFIIGCHLFACAILTLFVLFKDTRKCSQQGTVDLVLSSGIVNTSLCTNPKQCFSESMPWADDEPLADHVWFPISLMCVFEFISLAFAVFYFADLYLVQRSALRYWLPGILGLCGACLSGYSGLNSSESWPQMLLTFACYLMSLVVFIGWDNWVEGCSKFITETPSALPENNNNGTGRHMTGRREWNLGGFKANPKGKRQTLGTYYGDAELDGSADIKFHMEVVLRYLEYSITAPLLFLAMLSLFVVDAPSWMYIIGWTGIFCCCMIGIPLHITYIVLSNTTDQPEVKLFERFIAVFGLGKWTELWVSNLYFLEGAWIGLGMSFLVLFYVARGFLFNTALPWFVLGVTWNVILAYMSFGIVSTFLYLRDSPGYFPLALDILSLSAKVPVVLQVTFAFWTMPGSCG